MILLFEVDKGKIILGSFPISFGVSDLNTVSFKSTENVAFFFFYFFSLFFFVSVCVCLFVQTRKYTIILSRGETHEYLSVPREIQEQQACIFPSGDYQILLST